MEKIEEIMLNWTGSENFDMYFFVFFAPIANTLFPRGRLGTRLCPYLILKDFLKTSLFPKILRLSRDGTTLQISLY